MQTPCLFGMENHGCSIQGRVKLTLPPVARREGPGDLMPGSPMRAEQQQGLQPEQLEQEREREREQREKQQRERKQREQQGGGDAAREALREALSGAASHTRLVGSFACPPPVYCL